MKKNRILFAAIALFGGILHAQNIGVNSTGATPNTSSILDLNTGNTYASPNGKGLLPPNVALTGLLDITTVASPATSLLVHNTATANTGSLSVVPGYYYFNGTKWVAFSGNGSNNWALLGNAGTNTTTNFLGTTDNIDLVFRTNNTEKMRLSNAGVLTNNSLTNITGSDLNGINVGSQRWSINTTGFVAAFHNQSGAAFANGLLVKTVGTATNNTIFDLATGTSTGVTTSVMVAKGDGKVGIGTATPTERFTIEGGDMQLGEAVATPGIGRRLFFSEAINNSYDPIYFQRENVGNDYSNLNLTLGDNYANPGGTGGDRFNVGATNGAGFQSILTVQATSTVQAPGSAVLNIRPRVGINVYDPLSDLHVGGNIEASYTSAGATHSLTSYGKLVPGAVQLRGAPVGTYSNTNGFIDFVNHAGSGFDFRIAFQREFGTSGALVFSDNVNNDFMSINQGNGNVGIRTLNPTTVLQISTSGFDGLSIKGSPLSGGSTGDVIFLEESGMEKGRISTENMIGVGGLIFSGSNVANGANHMAIIQNGNVGIGMPVPTFKLDVNGTVRGVGAFNTTSDRRKKKNIKPLTLNGLDIVKKLNPVSYDWIDVLDDGMKGTQLGFIAQELEQIIPSIVVTANDEQKSKSVKYAELLPVYAKAIQEQQAQIELLKQEIEQLKKIINK